MSLMPGFWVKQKLLINAQPKGIIRDELMDIGLGVAFTRQKIFNEIIMATYQPRLQNSTVGTATV